MRQVGLTSGFGTRAIIQEILVNALVVDRIQLYARPEGLGGGSLTGEAA